MIAQSTGESTAFATDKLDLGCKFLRGLQNTPTKSDGKLPPLIDKILYLRFTQPIIRCAKNWEIITSKYA